MELGGEVENTRPLAFIIVGVIRMRERQRERECGWRESFGS